MAVGNAWMAKIPTVATASLSLKRIGRVMPRPWPSDVMCVISVWRSL